MEATPAPDNNERGGIALAALIAVVGTIALIWLVADACIEDESEKNDLGAPALVLADPETSRPPNDHPDPGRDYDGRRRCDRSRCYDEPEEEPARKCAAIVVVACGDLIIPPGAFDPGGGEPA